MRLTDEAKLDLREIGRYISDDNPHRAISFMLEIQQKCLDIAKNPGLYRLREELPAEIRAVRFKKYLIFYLTSKNNDVTVLRILHGSRNIPDFVRMDI